MHINSAKRKNTKEARDPEILFRSLVEQSHLGILVAQGPVPKAVFVNKSLTQMLGYSAQDFSCPDQIVKMVPPEDIERFFRFFKDRMEGNSSPRSYECRAVRKDGRIVWLEISSGLIKYNGQPSVQMVLSDITERKETERELFDNQMRLQNIFDVSAEAIAVINLSGEIVDINYEAQQLFGYPSKNDAIGKNALEPIVERDRERALKNMEKTLESGAMRNIEYAIKAEDCGERLLSVSASVLKDVSGNPTGFVSVMEDITERRQMEDALRQSEEKYRNLSWKMSNLMKTSAAMLNSSDLYERLATITEAVCDQGWKRAVISLKDENLETTEIVTAGLTMQEEENLRNHQPSGDVWRKRLGSMFEDYRLGEFYYRLEP